MKDNFKQVVNLQAKKPENTEKPFLRRKLETDKQAPPKKSRAEEIDQVYNNNTAENIKRELSQIDKPNISADYSAIYKQLFFLLIVFLFAGAAFYFYSHRNKDPQDAIEKIGVEYQTGKWYSVRLTSKEEFYGYIKNISSDPVVLENVYYKYNQSVGDAESPIEETTNSSIRLVKRGKEAHGPDGSMNIVRSQVLYMEPLGPESKILKAILDNQK